MVFNASHGQRLDLTHLTDVGVSTLEVEFFECRYVWDVELD